MRIVTALMLFNLFGCGISTSDKEKPQADKNKAQATYKGMPASHWMKQLWDRDVATRDAAEEALYVVGDSVVDDLGTALKTGDGDLKLTVIRVLGRVGPPAKKLIPT